MFFKQIFKAILIILIVIFCEGCKNSVSVEIDANVLKNTEEIETYYGYLIIPKINFKKGFFNEKSVLNDVNKNIEFIKTNINNTYLFAAHSGTGNKSFFNGLKELKKDDDIYLEFKDKKIRYKVSKIRKDLKNGTLKIDNKENMIYLTTCDQIIKGFQLTIEGIEINQYY